MVRELMNVSQGKRKADYNKLRLSLLEEKDVSEDEEVVVEVGTFWSRCSKCRLRHRFERKYVGKRLVCPSCEHFFVGVEVDDNDDDDDDDKVEEDEVGSIVTWKEVVEEDVEDWEMTSLNELVVGKARLSRKKVNLVSKRKMSRISEVLERDENVRNETPIVEESRRGCREKSKGDGRVLVCGIIGKELEVRKVQVNREKKSGIIREKVEKLRNDELGGVEGEDGEEMEDLTLAEIRTKALGKSKGKKEERKAKAINAEVVVHKKDERVGTMRRVVESGELEVMAVEDSDFYDFDEDRVEKSFKKGQVWAIYDDSDGMPRHYGLIDDVTSVNPFTVKMSWLDFQSEGDERLMSWEKNGFHISCGKYKVARKDDINLLNIFSHVVQCERAARELYLVYPRKGSVWALYDEKTLNFEARNSPSSHLRSYDIVLCLTSYDATYGVSIAYLEKVDGYKAVFMRREIGYNAVRTLLKNEIRVFSHQIPARKLSNDDVIELTNDCWELDPASLPQDLLAIK